QLLTLAILKVQECKFSQVFARFHFIYFFVSCFLFLFFLFLLIYFIPALCENLRQFLNCKNTNSKWRFGALFIFLFSLLTFLFFVFFFFTYFFNFILFFLYFFYNFARK